MKNSKGAKIFAKIIKDRKEVSNHIKSGGKLSTLEGKFEFKTFSSLTNNLVK
jgi:hypothetical protein